MTFFVYTVWRNEKEKSILNKKKKTYLNEKEKSLETSILAFSDLLLHVSTDMAEPSLPTLLLLLPSVSSSTSISSTQLTQTLIHGRLKSGFDTPLASLMRFVFFSLFFSCSSIRVLC